MDTIVHILMVFIFINLTLKQTFNNLIYVFVFSLITLLFTGLSCPFVIEQSITNINSKLSDYSFVLNLSVLLCIDVFLYIGFCIYETKDSKSLNKLNRIAKKSLNLFSGFLFFVMCFFSLSMVLYSFPGKSFYGISWGYALILAVLIPIIRKLFLILLPTKDTRLELLFVLNIIVLLLSVLITVVNAEAIIGISNIDYKSLIAIVLITIFFATIGIFVYKIKINKLNKKI